MAKFTPALVLAVCMTSLGACRAQEMTKPLGKWERKSGKSHVTLIVEENRLHVTFIGENPCTLHADYAMTKDGVVYGVVTSIECDDDEDAVKTMFDAPFSCRYRIDEGALIVRDLKCHETDSKDSAWTGRFKAVSPISSHTAVLPSSPSASASVGVGVGQRSEQQSDNASQSVASSASSNEFLEKYYQECAWPEALRPSQIAKEEERIKQQFNFWRSFTR